jgi:RNA polymerase sigma-70 factor (ECF subfamily)
MQTTSPSLLARLRQPGQQQAWSRFVDLYAPLLYHWARRPSPDPDDAADLVQDVFVILVRQLPRFVHQPGERGTRKFPDSIPPPRPAFSRFVSACPALR